MSNRLKILIAVIQAITDKNLEEIAKSIGYGREHLGRVIKKGGDSDIEAMIQQKYKREIEYFFGGAESILNEEPAEYGKEVKIVDFEALLAHDTILIKGMLRVMLKNQGTIIASQLGKPVSSILKQIAKDVRDETKEEFDEL